MIIGLLVAICVLIVFALGAAIVTSILSAPSQQWLHEQIGATAQSTAALLDRSLKDNDLGTAGITARMSGLTEFLHSLSSVAESGNRSGLPALAVLAAGLLVVGGGVVVIVDRVESRREFQACVDSVAGIASAPPTTSTTAAPKEPSEPADDASPEGESTPDSQTTPGDTEAAPEPDGQTEHNFEPATPGVQTLFATCLQYNGGGGTNSLSRQRNEDN